MRCYPILCYHQIAPAPARGARFRGLYVSPGAFARQMALLRLLGYQGLSMAALTPYLRGEREGRVVGLSFDDGFLNNLEHALPVLRRHGFSSTCYVVSQRLGQSNEWDRDQGVPASPLMSAEQLRAWSAGGQEVGAHSRHHVHLDQLDADEAEREIAGSRSELEQLLQQPVRAFCYPYGDYRPEQVAVVRAAGFESATTTQRGRARPGDDLLQLARVPVLRTTSLALLAWKLVSAYEDRSPRPAATAA